MGGRDGADFEEVNEIALRLDPGLIYDSRFWRENRFIELISLKLLAVATAEFYPS